MCLSSCRQVWNWHIRSNEGISYGGREQFISSIIKDDTLCDVILQINFKANLAYNKTLFRQLCFVYYRNQRNVLFEIYWWTEGMSTLLVVSNISSSKFAYKTHFSFLFTLFLAGKENTEIRGRIIEILKAFLRGIMSQTTNPALPIMSACDGDWQTTCC